MNREIASILIVAAFIIGAGIGYYGSTTSSKTTTLTTTLTVNNTKTIVSNYTVTTTVRSANNSTNLLGVNVMQCAVTTYDIVGENTTDSTSPQIYNITTSLSQTVGFATTTTKDSNITFNGTVDEWAVTSCTVVSDSG